MPEFPASISRLFPKCEVRSKWIDLPPEVPDRVCISHSSKCRGPVLRFVQAKAYEDDRGKTVVRIDEQPTKHEPSYQIRDETLDPHIHRDKPVDMFKAGVNIKLRTAVSSITLKDIADKILPNKHRALPDQKPTPGNFPRRKNTRVRGHIPYLPRRPHSPGLAKRLESRPEPVRQEQRAARFLATQSAVVQGLQEQ